MATLMSSDRTCWNEQLVNSLFLPYEAQQIKAIPLCLVPQPDYLYWSVEKNGIYFVKSCYKLLCEESRREDASISNREGMVELWSRIWKLKVPGKILHILWRACADCLPTKVNIMKRRIVDDSHCELCGRLPNDTKHALWSCEAMRRVWCMDFNWVTEGITAYGSFLDLVELCLTKPSAGELFGIIAWLVWMHRNKVRLKEKTMPLSRFGEAAKKFLQQVKVVREVHEVRSVVKQPIRHKWFPPAATKFKANFDGAWFNESEEAGIRVVVRDSSGQVLAALAEKIKKPHSVDYLEMMAARRAVIFAQEIGLQKCQFEGDSKTIIKALKIGDMSSLAFGHLVRDTLAIVNSFLDFSFSHIVRQGNVVAHALP